MDHLVPAYAYTSQAFDLTILDTLSTNYFRNIAQ
jgi:hypothetical protein